MLFTQKKKRNILMLRPKKKKNEYLNEDEVIDRNFNAEVLIALMQIKFLVVVNIYQFSDFASSAVEPIAYYICTGFLLLNLHVICGPCHYCCIIIAWSCYYFALMVSSVSLATLNNLWSYIHFKWVGQIPEF